MTQWIAAIARGHNAGVCLLKDGELVFALEEERLSRNKYDGGPYANLYVRLVIVILLEIQYIRH
jgi:predicted NodU family carbamoyl transferase